MEPMLLEEYARSVIFDVLLVLVLQPTVFHAHKVNFCTKDLVGTFVLVFFSTKLVKEQDALIHALMVFIDVHHPNVLHAP